jgi:hypothetical protein
MSPAPRPALLTPRSFLRKLSHSKGYGVEAEAFYETADSARNGPTAHAPGQTGQPSLGEGKWQVSKDHGNWPEWRVKGEIVFNTAPSGTAAFAAPVNTSGTAFESGVPQRLSLPASIDVVSTPQSSLDGQPFLVEMTQDPRAPRTSISVVLNWPALLKQ